MSKAGKPQSGNLSADRAQVLLKYLVERYIRDGQPVGSRTLAKDSGLDLSPATIRNVMADLEDMGLIRSPHTSAGRVPTAKGYRIFVDSLLTIKPMRSQDVENIRQKLTISGNTDNLISQASDMLSRITQLAGVVTLPRRERVRLQHIEFLPLSTRRVLVILVVNGQEVQNRVIDTEREYSASELQQAANYLNCECAGLELQDVRSRLLASMQQARDAMHHLMQESMRIADQILDQRRDEDYVLAGQTNLMNYAEMCDIDKLRHLFHAFNTKRDILHILDQSIHAEGMQIFIGEESGYQVLDECSLVMAPYKVDNEVIGVLGVIGPTRMAYDRVIPIVDVTAKVLSAALRQD
ncbi:MAG: heat-inducible transcriptional repressor HrcA [Gammaproteobacteria bacterium]|nr:heat-inducible transcriptional repressor HrcA [Gammaproteobacteria bacterium]